MAFGLLTCCGALAALPSSCFVPVVCATVPGQQHPISPVDVRMPSEITSTRESAATHTYCPPGRVRAFDCVFVSHFDSSPLASSIKHRRSEQHSGVHRLPPEGTPRQPGQKTPHRLHRRRSPSNRPDPQTNMAPFEKSMEMMSFKQRKCLGESHFALVFQHRSHILCVTHKRCSLFQLFSETRKDEVCTIRTKFPNKLPVSWSSLQIKHLIKCYVMTPADPRYVLALR